MNKLIAAFLLFFLGQTLIWVQTNGQFVWPWFKEHPILLAIFGVPISYLLIISTKYMVAGFNGLLWPGRLVGFSLGMIVFAILTAYLLNEGLTSKTIVSLVLATSLVLIQILWK